MNSRLLLAVVLLALLAGCSRHLSDAFVPNQRPQLEILDARADRSNPTDVRVRWAARDADGSVSRVLYTLAPMRPSFEPAVPAAAGGSDLVLHRPARPLRTAYAESRPQPDLLTLWAVDNRGAESEPVRLAMFDTNIAPTVQIICPIPFATSTVQTPPNMSIGWTGVDPDGVHTQHPVQYKYKLLRRGNTEFDIDFARTNGGPDSLRRYYAATNWAGWDSTGGDTTSVRFTNLIPNETYLFVITAFDEAGDYDPVFSASKNMLFFQVGYAGALGPRLTLWNSEFYYAYPTGGWSTAPSQVITVEEPAGLPITFNVSAQPALGQQIAGYRWELDAADPHDRTVRSDPSDLAHWSDWGMFSQIRLGPFSPAGVKRESHTLYIEASSLDCAGVPDSGMVSLGIIHFVIVRGTYNNELLVIDDTRLEVDQFINNARKPYGQAWPAAAELDTFLYARGGFPWRGTVNPPTGAISPPGLLAGYSFDTLGTRGYINGQAYAYGPGTVPLSTLADYRHVMWMVDHNGGINLSSPTNALTPMSSLHYMNTPGHLNGLAEYIALGGRVWLMGGDAALASLREYNAVGADNNDRDYAPIIGWVFAGPGYAHHGGKEELVPGRMMFDDAHWRSLMMCQTLVARFNRSPSLTTYPDARWTDQPGYLYANPVHRPDYSLLPSTLHLHTNPASDPVNGEPVPPTRATTYSSTWWSTSVTVDAEYLLQPNVIVEDMNPDPSVDAPESALDTLMSAQGSALVAGGTGYEPAAMTWYHGVAAPEIVFTGFPIWSWRRSDCQALVDFVLQQIWHMTKSPLVVEKRPRAVLEAAATRTTAPAGRVAAPGWRATNRRTP